MAPSVHSGQYVDAATQTSPFPSPLISPVCPASPITSLLIATSLSHTHRTTLENRLDFEKDDGSRASESGCVRSPEPCKSDPHSSDLSSLPSSFGLQRQNGLRMTQSTNRTVSLPETLCDQDLHLALSQLIENSAPEKRDHPRVVSMPEPAHWQSGSPTAQDTLQYGESEEPSLGSVCSDENLQIESEGSPSSSSPSTPRTVVIHSLSPNLFNTPSPSPSSCDSVEFTLEDPVRLPESFLRGPSLPPVFVPAAARKATDMLEDNGWLTWANSPPRPIPALHGPSSLPYARCPSGAEGTIIGEQSSLPRMIWGLDPNDALPTAHTPHRQQTRPVPIKPPSDNLHRNSLRASPSTPAMLTSPLQAPRSGFSDASHHFFPEIQNVRRLSFPVERPESRSEGAFRGMTRGGAGLGFSVNEAVGDRRESGIHGASTDPPHLYQLPTAKTMDGDIEMMSLEQGAENQCREEAQERFDIQPRRIGPAPSNFVELLSNHVRFPMDKPLVPTAAPRFTPSNQPPGYLLTPPSSTSPLWSPAFSPQRYGQFSAMDFAHNGNDVATDFKMLSKMCTTNDELSHELRRFVFEKMSSNSINTGSVLRTSSMPPSRPAVYASSVESPTHPPGLPIPRHIISQAPSFNLQTPVPPSISTSARSTLSNPRSIPLSRLRQKGGAVKLATVPEEDATEVPWPIPNTLRLPTRASSPLFDSLQPQSVVEKGVFGEEELKTGNVRVKLPYTVDVLEDVSRSLDSSQGATPQGSPKKKKLQRRRKPAASKLVDIKRVGFPLISRGAESFVSTNSHATRDSEPVRSLSLVGSVMSESIGKAIEASSDASGV